MSCFFSSFYSSHPVSVHCSYPLSFIEHFYFISCSPSLLPYFLSCTFSSNINENVRPPPPLTHHFVSSRSDFACPISNVTAKRRATAVRTLTNQRHCMLAKLSVLSFSILVHPPPLTSAPLRARLRPLGNALLVHVKEWKEGGFV